jgi:hypothetical protein
MSHEKPRLGPWLRNAGRPDPGARDGAREYLVAGAVAVGVLLLLSGVMLAFVRFPFPTLGALVAVWGVGYAIYRVKRQRADLQDQLRRMDLERDIRPRRDAGHGPGR